MENKIDILPAELKSFFFQHKNVAIAFSGGLDSRFLCHAAKICGCNIIAVHAKGPHIAQNDSEYAREWAKSQKISFAEIFFDPLIKKEIRNNSRERCYFCKSIIISKILHFLAQNRFENHVLCDGGNLDDLKKYRPGINAAREAGVLSPLAIAKLDKREIRRLSRITGLSNAGQAARPCLLTRFPYDTQINTEQLKIISIAEKELQVFFENNGQQIPDFRLRILKNPELHITFLPENQRNDVEAILANNGLAQCVIRQVDNISGFFDKN